MQWLGRTCFCCGDVAVEEEGNFPPAQSVSVQGLPRCLPPNQGSGSSVPARKPEQVLSQQLQTSLGSCRASSSSSISGEPPCLGEKQCPPEQHAKGDKCVLQGNYFQHGCHPIFRGLSSSSGPALPYPPSRELPAAMPRS